MISLKSAARGERGLAFTDHSGGCPAAVGGDHSLSSMMCIKFCFVCFHLKPTGQRDKIARGSFSYNDKQGSRGLEAGIEWVCSSVISWGLKHLLLAFHFQKKNICKNTFIWVRISSSGAVRLTKLTHTSVWTMWAWQTHIDLIMKSTVCTFQFKLNLWKSWRALFTGNVWSCWKFKGSQSPISLWGCKTW